MILFFFINAIIIMGMVSPSFCADDARMDEMMRMLLNITQSQQDVSNKVDVLTNQVDGLTNNVDGLSHQVSKLREGLVEVHTFFKTTATTLRPVPFPLNSGTAFCLMILGDAYIVTAAHLWASAPVANISFADIAIIDPTAAQAFAPFNCLELGKVPIIDIGDHLLAVGFDHQFVPGEPLYRAWAGDVQTILSCKIHAFPNEQCFATNAIQPRGLSGDLVLNDCGLVGVAVAADFGLFITDDKKEVHSLTHTVVHPIEMILRKLREYMENHMDELNKFKVSRRNIKSVQDIPRKFFCDDVPYLTITEDLKKLKELHEVRLAAPLSSIVNEI